MSFIPNIDYFLNLFFAKEFGFTLLDFIILSVIFFYAVEGLYVGFIQALLDLTSFVLSFVIALKFYSFFAKLLIERFFLPHGFANAAGFFIAALFIEILLSILLRGLLARFPKDLFLGKVNRILGFLPGAFSAIILLSFLLTLVVSMPASPVLKRGIAQSKLGSLLVVKTSFLEKRLNDVFGGAINDTLSFLTVKPQSDELIKLNFSTRTYQVDAQAEQEMFELVNRERVASGLPTLEFDDSLRDVARSHSEDMVQRGYFSHYTPEGLSPFDRMANANIQYTVAGENLAFAPNVLLAHQGLMQSPGHKANILSPQFKKVGIGVIDAGIFGQMFTQEFTD